MGVLKFDDTNDYVRFGTVATPLANVSDGAWTVAALLKRNGTGSNWDGISYAISTATIRAGMSFNGTSPNNDKIYMDYGSNRQTTSTFTNTTDPYLFALSKGAGTATPRLGWQNGSGSGSLTHENLSGTQADTGTCTLIDIGSWKTSTDYFNGWIGLVAWWEGAMSDANKDALNNNWRTSDWYNNAHGTPVFICEMNVSAASLVDITGNGTGLSVPNPPTLDSGETLNSWNFDGTGAGGGVTVKTLAALGVG